MKKTRILFCFGAVMAALMLMAALAGIGPVRAENAAHAPEGTERVLRILMTSDIHGKFYPYNYVRNTEDSTGSLAQIATAIREYRTEDTLMVDCGDCVQGNATEFFLENHAIHPVMAGLNWLGYEIWVAGNHECKYGMDTVRRVSASFEGKTLTGNVVDGDGKPLADGYTILDKNGVRVAVIGMVTPCVQFGDRGSPNRCEALDPVAETRKIIDSIQGRYDVLIGAMHMGIEDEYGYPDSGVRSLAEACPEFDVILASHMHTLVEEEWINGVLVTENRNAGKTMAVIDLVLEPTGEGWTVAEAGAGSVSTGQYEPDPAFMEAFREQHEEALAVARTEIGTFDGDSLVPESEAKEIPAVLTQDTPLIDLLHAVLLHYSGADVCCIGVTSLDSDLSRGPIRNCDVSNLYIYSNTIYLFRMSGKQLKQYMEWNAGWYNQLMPGDLTISFNRDLAMNQYHMFAGIRYEIDISREQGSRILNLTWPDGRPVEEEDSFLLATDNYSASTQLMNPGRIFSAEELPILVEMDLNPDIGEITGMIRDYIVHECGGVLKPCCDDNWRLVGISWDEALHAKAVELLREEKLHVPLDDTERIAVGPVREKDL